MSYYGWDGKESALQSSELLAVLFALRHAGIGADLNWCFKLERLWYGIR
jgi:hypothetical protein